MFHSILNNNHSIFTHFIYILYSQLFQQLTRIFNSKNGVKALVSGDVKSADIFGNFVPKIWDAIDEQWISWYKIHNEIFISVKFILEKINSEKSKDVIFSIETWKITVPYTVLFR